MSTPLHILILEDHPDDAELLTHELRRAGISFSCRLAADRESYLAALDEPPDLILADYTLPDLDAPEALRLLRERRLDAPFIVVTGSVSEEKAVACIRHGAADYLLKDRLTRLGTAVAQALEQGQLRAYQRQAELALWESVTVNQAVLNSLASHIVVLDERGTILAVNQAWQRFGEEYGAEPASTGVGANYLEVCRRSIAGGCQEAAYALAGLEAVMRGEADSFVLEYSMRMTRAVLWFLLRVAPLDGAQGRVVVSHANITARKDMELALQASEERFRLIYQNAPIGIALADLEGHLLSSNPVFQSMLGYSAEDLYFTAYWDLAHPEEQETVQKGFARLVSGVEESCTAEQRFVERGGLTIWGKASLSLARDAAGTPLYMVLTLEDITSRKQAYMARSRLAAIIDSSNDAIVGKDLNGIIVAWNRGAERVYGYTADEIIGQPVSVLIPPENLANEQANLEHVRHGRQSAQYERVRVRKDGERINLSVSHSPIVDDDGQIIGISAIGHDITSRMAAQRAFHRQTTFVHLLQRVAVAANQAVSLDAVLQVAVEQICQLIGWPVGHVYIASKGEVTVLLSSDIWYLADPEHYAVFRKITDANRLASMDDLPGRVLLSGTPEWVSDLTAAPIVPRSRLISNIGVRAGFALPVLIGAEVAAVLEFFAPEAIEPDAALLEVMAHVGTQLGQVFERQRAQDALRASEERYRLIAESTSDVITLADSTGRYVYISPASRPILGYEPQEVIGASVFDMVHPADHHLMAELLRGQRPLGAERLTLRVRHAAGGWRWFETHCTLLVQHGVAYALGVSRDVTERMQAEEEIKRSEERYRTLFETMSQGVVYQDADGQITSINPATERILGLSLAQMQGRTSLDPRWRSIHADGTDFSGEAHPAMVALRDGVPVRDAIMGVYNSTEERYRWLSVSAVPQFRPGEGRPYQVYTTFQDITEQKIAEETLREERALLARRVEERTADLSAANAELAQAARLKDEFLASMSHELRTPLNAVLGLSEALAEATYGPVNREQRQTLGLIEESGRHLLELINDILDLAKIGAGKVELELDPVSVKLICQACVRMVEHNARKKQLDLRLDLGAAPRMVCADMRRLKQILVNLLANAVKFTPAGRALGLEVVADPVGQVARFTVWDEGIGIARDQHKHLFQPFVQLDSRLARQYQGTGLGLALVYKLTEMHGGSVAVASEPGVGSRFTVVLPWYDTDETLDSPLPADTVTGEPRLARRAPAQDAAPVAALGRAGRPATILLAEDNEMNIRTVSDYLSSIGYRIVVARNGTEAVAQARELCPDLILMDIQMPNMDGLEATRRIRAQCNLATTPIIALTALAMPGDRERCLEAGANTYMSKPVSLHTLANAISAFLQPAANGARITHD